jgi:chemotaxis protein methyltransferase CheR
MLSEAFPARLPFDLVLCRNVLLYFDRETRARAFDRLANAVMPDGFLMLGAGETVVGQTDRFVPTARRASFFELQSAPQASVLRQMA